MYARGMSNKDIHDQIEEIYGVKISPDMVTAITDKIIPEIQEWRQRQLNEQYAIGFVRASESLHKLSDALKSYTIFSMLFYIILISRIPIL